MAPNPSEMTISSSYQIPETLVSIQNCSTEIPTPEHDNFFLKE
jgi:hypothetical protein